MVYQSTFLQAIFFKSTNACGLKTLGPQQFKHEKPAWDIYIKPNSRLVGHPKIKF